MPRLVAISIKSLIDLVLISDKFIWFCPLEKKNYIEWWSKDRDMRMIVAFC
jgi:hypothetical protein